MSGLWHLTLSLIHLGGRHYFSAVNTTLAVSTANRSHLLSLYPFVVYHFPCDYSFSFQACGIGSCPTKLHFRFHINVFVQFLFHFIYCNWFSLLYVHILGFVFVSFYFSSTLKATNYFTSLDLTAGFWQVTMEPESCEHAAFITYGGLYEFLVMPFSLTGTPSTYQLSLHRKSGGAGYLPPLQGQPAPISYLGCQYSSGTEPVLFRVGYIPTTTTGSQPPSSYGTLPTVAVHQPIACLATVQAQKSQPPSLRPGLQADTEPSWPPVFFQHRWSLTMNIGNLVKVLASLSHSFSFFCFFQLVFLFFERQWAFT